jgi:hypothetical protein
MYRAPHTRHSTMTWLAMCDLGRPVLPVLAGGARRRARHPGRRILSSAGRRRASAAGILARAADVMVVRAAALSGATPQAREPA